MTWTSVKLSELASVQSGGGAPQDADAFTNEGVPFVRAGSLVKLLEGLPEDRLELLQPDIAAAHRLKIFPIGTVLFAKSGMSATKGHVYQLKGPAYVVNHLAALVPRSDADSKYLPQVLKFKSPTCLIKDEAYPSIRLGDIEEMEVPAPRSATERARIAAILDQADDLRRKRKQALDRLNQLGQAIFYEMFGDPIANDKGFGTKPLEELIQSSRGISYGIVQRGPDQDDGIPVVRISDIVHGKFEAESLVRTTAEISQKYRRTILQGGELLISIRGTVGALARVPEHIHGVNISREVAQIPLLNGVSWRFILFLLRSPEAQRRLVEDVKGVAQSGINLADLRKISIIQPSKPAIEEFEQRILQLERLTDATNLRSCELDGLWSSLQHRAFRGEL